MRAEGELDVLRNELDRLAKSKAQVTSAVLEALSREKSRRVSLERTLGETLPSSPLDFTRNSFQIVEEMRVPRDPGFESGEYRSGSSGSSSVSSRTGSSSGGSINQGLGQPYENIVPVTAVDKLKA